MDHSRAEGPSLSPALAEAIGRLRDIDPTPVVVAGAARPREVRIPEAGGQPAAAPPRSARSIASGVASGELQACEVIEECVRSAARWQHLNAFIHFDAEAARARARNAARGGAAGILAGVPIAHKDVYLTGDMPTTGGSRSLAGWRPPRDADIVRALAAAGACSLGKLNTHELATGITGTVSAAGPVMNPWSVRHLAGGSSSGSAAAVAAGIIPLATASDTGGSARIPAACCGAVGFKPTFGLLSTRGLLPFSWTLDHVGFIAREATDVALALAAAGSLPTRAVADTPRPLRGLRIACPPALRQRCDPAIRRALDDATARLLELGAGMVDAAWPEILGHVDGIAAAIFIVEGAAVNARALRSGSGLEPATRAFLRTAPRITPEVHEHALALRRSAIAAADEVFRAADLVISPTIPCAAPPIDAATITVAGDEVDVRAALTRSTRIWNVCGNPALSLPWRLDDGLPVAVQLTAGRGGDAVLLAAAIALEAARGPFPKPPVP